MRIISLERAKKLYAHRYTMEHIPEWSKSPLIIDGAKQYYAPQFKSDLEWYDNTAFPGELDYIGNDSNCYTRNQTWPLGLWLTNQFEG